MSKGKEIKLFFRTGCLFVIPVVVWVFIAVLVDPYNYFNISHVFSNQSKELSSKQTNTLLYNAIEFSRFPKSKVFIGDSRVKVLSADNSPAFYNLHSNAAKLNEMIDLFWFADSYVELEEVYMGVNFNLYNKYAYSNRMSAVSSVLKNPLLYVFNSNVAEAMWPLIQVSLLNKKINNKPRMTQLEFWDWNIQTKAFQHYSKYSYPEELYLSLQEMSNYCKGKNIRLTFVIVPHHQEFRGRVCDFKLVEEEQSFKDELKKMSRVIDFDYDNELTRDQNNFGDPIHLTQSMGSKLFQEIVQDSVVNGIVFDEY